MSKEDTEVEVPSKDELLDILDGNDIEVDNEDAPELTKVELDAQSKGWNPEGVEGKKNLSAEEFLDRQSLYDDLHSLKRHNKRLQTDLDNVITYQDRVRADEREKVVAELKTQKKDALDEGDHDRVIEIDEKLADAREDAKTPTKPAKEELNEDFEEWIGDNTWYKDDSELKDDADIYGEVYWKKNPTKTRNEVYDAVSKYIKRTHSDKFTNTKRDQQSDVEPSGGPTKRKSKSKDKTYSAKDLSPQERSIMKTILRTSKMNEQQYLKEYFS